MTPDYLSQIQTELLACACDALNQFGACPCPCRIFISAGPPVWDNEACCSDGQLTIHMERMFVHGNFPAEQGLVNVCVAPLAAEFNITLLRCFPTVRDDGSAPTANEIQAASESIYQDLYVMTKRVICCLANKGRNQKSVFRGSRIVPPSGGCIGAELRLTIELPD